MVTSLWNLLARIALPVVGCLTVIASPLQAPRVVVNAAVVAGAVGTAVTRSRAVASASSSSIWCSATSRARYPASSLRDMSCRAGMDMNARVSSTKPEVR